MSKEEYTEVMAHLRHYSGLRFAVLTVFIAIMGGLLTLSFGVGMSTPDATLARVARLAGIVITLAFACFEYVIDSYLLTFGKRANDLEHALGYAVWSQRPTHLRWIVTLAIGGLYLSVLVFWMFALVRNL
jgi:hypothetical protein